ncbi:MAG: hypothetical protein TREMPRED_003960 [Tremellales sp. Tagirdzhanova-0007]|nr:MAG: hypothetical protein TREMPRED_003960 [Tremellales sp. Tagirdzhanova-0007]
MSAELTPAPTTEKADAVPQTNGTSTKPASTTADASDKLEEKKDDGKNAQTGEKRKAENEVVDKGKGISTEEEKTAVEAEADPEDDLETLIMPGKRRRKDVDYSKEEAWKAADLDPKEADKDDEDDEDVVVDANGESPEDDEGEFVDNGEDAEDDEDDDEDEEK